MHPDCRIVGVVRDDTRGTAWRKGNGRRCRGWRRRGRALAPDERQAGDEQAGSCEETHHGILANRAGREVTID
jgi:hypothetical protein